MLYHLIFSYDPDLKYLIDRNTDVLLKGTLPITKNYLLSLLAFIFKKIRLAPRDTLLLL